MRRIAVLFLGLCIATAASDVARPAPAPRSPNVGLDSNAPIAVNADSFLADLNGETGTYTGNVIVTQGEVRLHADEVKVTAPGGRAAKMEAQGHVVVDSPSGQAVGDNGVYDVPSQILRLNGHVVLTKEANVMRGTALEVAMATGIARLMGGVEPAVAGQAAAGQAPPGRVQGLFFPAQRSGGSAPAANTNSPKP
ncbi:MAG TPA: LptA/OstA family protein [Micropepsaceae bacterium]|nr:LptA/OstA family protein [Micropepsaceae bacterium]